MTGESPPPALGNSQVFRGVAGMIGLLEAAVETLRTGEIVALGTIVRKKGSTPRATGTKMLVCPVDTC